jgi:hypothetical protein
MDASGMVRQLAIISAMLPTIPRLIAKDTRNLGVSVSLSVYGI